MPPKARVLLEDMRLAARDIEDFTRGRTLTDYLTNRLLRAAVERLFIVIGEALSRLERLDSKLAGRFPNTVRLWTSEMYSCMVTRRLTTKSYGIRLSSTFLN